MVVNLNNIASDTVDLLKVLLKGQRSENESRSKVTVARRFFRKREGHIGH